MNPTILLLLSLTLLLAIVATFNAIAALISLAGETKRDGHALAILACALIWSVFYFMSRFPS